MLPVVLAEARFQVKRQLLLRSLNTSDLSFSKLSCPARQLSQKITKRTVEIIYFRFCFCKCIISMYDMLREV